MFDQLVIGEVGSFDEFEASMKERTIGSPKKKIIKETVPFSNITHDFSGINGEVYWEERELEYVFEITAVSAEALAQKKMPFLSWLMNVVEQPIYDPYIAGYHFIGTFADVSCDDSEVEKSTITAKFTAFPYMISNTEKVYSQNLTTSEVSVTIQNNSSHRITPTFVNSVPMSITFGNTTISVNAGETTNESIKLTVGANVLKMKSTSGSGTVKIKFYEEVF